NSASTYEEGAKTTNAVLTELVNVRRTGVFVIAATNFVDRLDPAAVREGRFDFKIEIPAPDSEARRHLIKRQCKARIAPDTVETAVRRWEGFSVARIAAVVEEAGRMVKGGEVTFDVLKGALRTIQGRKGSIPEDTPTLAQLTMGEDNRNRLVALARRMDKIMEIEAMGGSVPRGVLFYGPPGTGKTLTARALAKTANWAFLSISGMDLLADPKRIDAIVEEASELRPCIVFIDEADDVFRDRRYSNTATVTNKLLAAMDGAGGKVPDILYIAATNHPDTMDPAALRGGRFTEKIEFGLPDEETVFAFLKKWKAETKAQFAANFSLQKAAERLAGHSIANVKEILQMAINNAIARIDLDAGTARVSMQDLDLAIQSVQGDFVEE
ncbi:MAG: ATP-binding protein, partial [Propionivibrio sp.]